MPAIAVYCSASERIDPVHVQLAADVGALIAARGHSLVSGGGSVSMMGAVAKAVREGGGRTYGVIPRALLEKEVGDRYADELVVTDGMRERKGLMDDAADAFVVLPGGLGTLEELIEVWSSKALAMHAKPVVACDPTGVLDPLRQAVDTLVTSGFVQRAAADEVIWTRSAAEALDAVEAGLAAAAGAAAQPSEAVHTQEGLESGAPRDGDG
ncbi:TIGR00730 family Rossman fold protein [Quadrisphaera setariae]|uniref:LOG family protein n=1 Tax=Quadrisphaera setariae TaxID=2593304 RepID=UPI002102F01F|nr:TIGR00730 family Rossman fold protein [Quadrisphaera setariae]